MREERFLGTSSAMFRVCKAERRLENASKAVNSVTAEMRKAFLMDMRSRMSNIGFSLLTDRINCVVVTDYDSRATRRVVSWWVGGWVGREGGVEVIWRLEDAIGIP